MSESPKIAFITGVSGGIGKALADALLKRGYMVVGLGRNSSITHPNFSFQALDLQSTADVSNFIFPETEAENYLLINNSGILGEVGPVGELSPKNFGEVMQINAIAPQILINQFISQFHSKKVSLHVLNISSGAGKRPIDGWASYCASKAALDLFSDTVRQEMTARHQTHFHIHAIAPGVVDTNMQGQIRNVSPEKFLASQRFHDLKKNNQLLSPDFVAEKLMRVIVNPSAFPNTLVSLSDI